MAHLVMMLELFLWLLLAQKALSACSNSTPIKLPITDVVLEDGNSIRGVLMTLGSPAQNLSWIPQMYEMRLKSSTTRTLTALRYLNDTWVYNTSLTSCPHDQSWQTSAWCTTYRGGLYDPTRSSSSKNVSGAAAAGASVSDTDRTVGLHVWDNAWVLDDVQLGNTTLSGYPIGMPGFDYGTEYHSQGAIGLGPNSTLLTALKEAGHISSRSYGYWWGQNGATANAQMDGSLILGGYDAAKTQGENLTLPLKSPSLGCMSGMYMTVMDIAMSFPNGTRASLVAPGAPLNFCLQVDFPAMMSIAIDPFYNKFELYSDTSHTESATGIDWWNPLYEPNDV